MITLQQDTIYMGTAAPASGGGGSGTVDQTYDPTSTNAQSGTAVAEALATVTVATDNSTISKNASNELEAISVINPKTHSAIGIWHGTQAQWDTTDVIKDTYYAWEGAGTTPLYNEITLPFGGKCTVAYGNGEYIVVKNGSTKTAHSTDGATWTEVDLDTSLAYGNPYIAYGNNTFVMINTISNYNIWYSTDKGATWTKLTVSYQPKGLCFGDGKFVVVGENGKIYTSTDGETWTEESTTPSTINNALLIAYNGSKYVILTSSTTAYYSDDAVTWTSTTQPNFLGSYGGNYIATGNGKFIASYYSSKKIAYSADGTTWTEITLDSNGGGVAYGDGKFVICGASEIFVSTDGENWTGTARSTTQKLEAITYGTKFLAVSSNSSYTKGSFINFAVYTKEAIPTTESTVYSGVDTTSALTITAVGTGTITLSDGSAGTYNSTYNIIIYKNVSEAYPNYLAHIDGFGIKIGDDTVFAIDQTYNSSSTNAVSAAAINSQGFLKDENIDSNSLATYSDGYTTQYYVVGTKDMGVQTSFSSSGFLSTWHGTEEEWKNSGQIKQNYFWIGTKQTYTSTSIQSGNWNSVAYGNGIYVAVGSSGVISYSTDNGATWTAATSPSLSNWSGVAYGNGMFVAVAKGSTNSAYSTDGINWTSATLPSSQDWSAVAFGNGKFMAVAQNSATGAIFNNNSWSSITLPSANDWRCIAFGNGKFVTVGYDSNVVIESSDDGSTWNSRTLSQTRNWVSIAYGEYSSNSKKFVIAAYNSNSFAYSSDGTSWSINSINGTGSSDKWISVVFGSYRFMFIAEGTGKIAIGGQGMYYVSTDAQASASNWTSIVFGGNRFVAVGTSGASGYIDYANCMFTDFQPNTSSKVYSDVGVESALTVTSYTSFPTAYVTLSDAGNYYNIQGTQAILYYTIGEKQPQWICYIDNVGVKIGTTLIATAVTGATGSYTTADSKTVTVTNGIITSIE